MNQENIKCLTNITGKQTYTNKMENNLDIKQIIAAAAKPRISIVMQSYLGNYPGSRKDSQSKFLRAVQSFQTQLYNNCELIIVADDCMETKVLYDNHFKNEENIRFIYVSRKQNELNTYFKNENGDKYFRGYPRRIGTAAADGDLITYMDSDDMLLPEFTLNIMIEYNKSPGAFWWVNRSWYDHESMVFDKDKTFEDTDISKKTELTDIEGRWNVSTVKEGLVVMSPWLLVHRPTSEVLWRDTWGGISEDADFNSRLRKKYKAGAVMNNPTYVRCHFVDKWDI